MNHVVHEAASPPSLKRKASETELPNVRKKSRIASEDTKNTSYKEVSQVVSDNDMTMVERRTSSGRKLKIVCYRMLSDGVIDKSGKRTSLSHESKSKKSPLVSPNAKPESSPVQSTSPSVKTSSVKKIGKIRALKDNELDFVLDSDDSENGNESSSEDEGIDNEPKHTEASRKFTKVSSLKDSASDTQNRSPKPTAKKQDRNHLEDLLKDIPRPEMITPKKSKKDHVKSKSTIKKRFKCEECAISFSSRAELQEHDEEEHDDFLPTSKTPSR